MHPQFRTVAAAVVCLTATLAAQQPAKPAAQQPGPTFRTGTQIVPVYVTVMDVQRRLIPDLTKQDFQIVDNGVPQEITLFNNDVQPFSAAVMLDTSLSMTLNFDLVKKSAEQFLIRLTPQDKAVVGSFNDKIAFTSDLSSDRDMLVSSLEEIGFGNPTRLFDAIDAGMDQLRGIDGRRVVIAFTDGDDTASKTSLGKIVDRAREDEVMIYSIGLESEMVIDGRHLRTKPDRGLKRISDETGGGYFELKRTDELGPTFTRVAQELRSQYLIGFTPATLDNKVHKLEVRITNPSYTARARRSYLAGPERGTK